jgi:uncharacterized membrane protein
VTDIKNSKLLWTKGILFLLIGVVSSVLLLLESPSLKVGLLLALAVWAFCRVYYFAFYVIEHYADPSYRFAGLISFIGYALRRRKQD